MPETLGLQTSTKPTLAKPAQIYPSPTNSALCLLCLHRQTSSQTLPIPYATRLTLKLTTCNSSSESVSFLAAVSFLSLVQQLIWQLIFRFGSALPQQNPEDNELMGEGIRFS